MSRGTLDPAVWLPPSLTGLSPSLAGLPRTILLDSSNHVCSPNPGVRAHRGYGLHLRFCNVSGTVLGKPAGEGESPVDENRAD